jgi:hypothetical protein
MARRTEASMRPHRGSLSGGQDDDLASQPVLFHAAMRLGNLVEIKTLADVNPEIVRLHLPDEVLQRIPGE